MPRLLKPHPVDDGAVLRQPEQARTRIARLRQRRHRAGLHEAEAETRQRAHHPGVLVEAGGDADRVGEAQPHRLDRQRRVAGAVVMAAEAEQQPGDGELVRPFGIHPVQEGGGKRS